MAFDEVKGFHPDLGLAIGLAGTILKFRSSPSILMSGRSLALKPSVPAV
jgi:hypothetical protein